MSADTVEPKARKYVINFFGWCYDPGSKIGAKKHDKVWGWVTIGFGDNPVLYNFWGSRADGKNKAIKFKRHDSYGDVRLHRLTQKKMKDRPTGKYAEVAADKIETVYPGFYEHFEKQLFLAKLFDRIRGEGDYLKEKQ